ncbi:uncharacterized protein TRIADDRAFT_51908 [Trichoplax adhaerens]|uniref:Kringle domain-containing protein n=1 Tax=Trichoplax adhaerens TaxID=10228 RepID=B3RL79_TRIAD|nr:hypothetical protein TRIADDRAFT_51908 [Trichoplax adhaerens]EDV28717.1 hypothetical protein TRIADDRAFT_51908 [Trichoplax adhaerens]|eukprot:XP_002107919.1 hypothetical protein TRIADDRAFT_51908 [Trichoplax adhaerens]
MASKAIAILYVTLVYLSFTIIATYGDQVAVKESKDDCPSNCKCENDQVRCSHFILNQDLQLPEKTKLLIFENAVSCEDEHLHNLLPLALSKQIKISGQCSKPKRLIGSSLAELIAEKLSSTNHLRDKRSNFATPSIYNFTVSFVIILETPQATAGCTFDEGMCGWVQLSNVDFFDWTRHSGSTPSSYTGPRYDHTSNSTEGFYIYTETSRPRVLGEYADLMSPPMLAATSSSTVEVKFYYHAYGSSLGKLQLYAMYPSVSQAFYSITNVSLYSVNQWRPFSTTFQPLYNPYRIIIRGTVGQSYTGDNAIDDIFISSVENNCYVPFSEVYRGINSQTTSGSYCRSWASSTAQYYNHTPSNYPYSDLGFSYCRNPGGERSRPWCYVSTGSTWDYCNIPRCIAPTTTRAQYPLGRRYPVALINFDHGQHYIGRVAIYHDGEWGTIYGRSLSHSFIGLLCKQAGLGNYGLRYYGAGYGIAGVGKVWLDYTRIACPASSNSINNCTLGSWGSTYGHSSDLWLTCSWHSTNTTANPAVSTCWSLLVILIL